MENNQCPLCKSELKTIPAGISKKTNKPYNSFTACKNRDCDYTKNSSTSAPQPSGDVMNKLTGMEFKLGNIELMVTTLYEAYQKKQK